MSESEVTNNNQDNTQTNGLGATLSLSTKTTNDGLNLAMQSVNESSSLDKVRDILFGHQVRDIDTRFSRLEEKLVKECANLRDETRSRLDALENYLKQEVESLTSRIQGEHGDRDRAVTLLQEETQTLKSTLEQRISQVEDYANRNQRELREQVFNQSKTLQDTIQQKYEEIIALLEQESKNLRHQKTDRSTLAALLNELAIRLNS